MAVFERPQATTDHLPESVVEELAATRSTNAMVRIGGRDSGRILTDESRLALALGDPSDVRIYVVPTDRGAVCVVLQSTRADYLAISWEWKTHEGVAPSIYVPGDGPGFVFGLLENGLTALTVDVGGNKTTAKIGENVFMANVEDGRLLNEKPIAVQIVRTDGVTLRVAVDEATLGPRLVMDDHHA